MSDNTATTISGRVFSMHLMGVVRSRLRARVRLGMLIVMGLGVLSAFLCVSTASAATSFCPKGNGAGQCEKPEGVAVDRETGHLYVADVENNRIDVFDSAGNFIKAFGWGVDTGAAEFQSCTTASTCQAGISGPGAGQLWLFPGGGRLAVDNDPASPSHHDLYVSDLRNHRVQKFSPEGVFLRVFGKGVNTGTSGKPNICTNAGAPTDVCGAGSEGGGAGEFNELEGIGVDGNGLVDIIDMKQKGPCTLPGVGGGEYEKRMQRFNDSGEPTAQLSLTNIPCGQVTGFAVSSGGGFYVANSDKGIGKYDASGNPLATLDPGIQTTALAVDGADDLFIAQNEPRAAGNFYDVLGEFNPSGVILHRFGYGTFALPSRGLAPFHSAAGDVFASEDNSAGSGNKAIKYLSLPSAGPIVAPPSLEAAPVRSTRATLVAEANPEGKETRVQFDYVTQSEFETSGFLGANVKHGPEVTIGSDFNLHADTYQATGLAPSTRYHFRAVATNSEGSQTVEGNSFETLGPFEILGTWATEVGDDAATVHGEANPLGSTTTGYFEYVDQASFEASGFAEATRVPSPSTLAFGSGETPVSESAVLSPLAPGTIYHYRITVEDPFATQIGPERVFTTLVALTQSNTTCPNQEFRTSFSAALPDCRAYEMVSPVEKNNGDVVPEEDPTSHAPSALDQSSTDGSKLTFSSATAFGGAQVAPWNSQYLSVRGEGGWRTQAISPPMELSVGAAVNLALRGQYRAFSPDLCSGWLISNGDPPLTPDGVAHFPNIYRRADCGEAGYEALTTAQPPHEEINTFVNSYFSHLELQGLSADRSKAIYVAPDNLTPEARDDPERNNQLYARGEGQLRYVCMLPNGAAIAAKAGCAAGDPSGISGDGLRANVKNALSADGSRIYWTADTQGGIHGPGQIYLRESPYQEQSEVSAGKCTEPEKACTIAVSETVNKEPAHFYAASVDGAKAIFSLHVSGSQISEDLYEFDAAQGKSTLIAAEAKGVMGASEDLSRIYFATAKDLSGGGIEGKPNLYLYEAGEGGPGSYSFIATLTEEDIAGDRIPATARQPFERTSRVGADGLHAVFMTTANPTGYDNADAKNGEADSEVYLYDAVAHKLVCASCNPSGARPLGHPSEQGGNHTGVSSQIPGWQSSLYPGRVLTDNGKRLFFESADALVATDTNGAGDVYEWEAPGEGDCTSTSPTFAKANEGCVSLISSGQSQRASQIVDSSPDGSDVFIRTLSSLLPQDRGLVDIYDARVGGGFPAAPNPPAACEGEACEGQPSALNDPTPASASFSGPGDLVTPLPASVAVKETVVRSKTAAQLRAQALAKALKGCRAKKGSKRKACEAAARKRYGAKSKKAKKANGKGGRS